MCNVMLSRLIKPESSCMVSTHLIAMFFSASLIVFQQPLSLFVESKHIAWSAVSALPLMCLSYHSRDSGSAYVKIVPGQQMCAPHWYIDYLYRSKSHEGCSYICTYIHC